MTRPDAERRAYRGYILDVDGVLVRGGEIIPGAADAVARLRDTAAVVLLTNNSTRSRSQHAAQLAGVGIEMDEDQIVSSASLTATWLLERDGPSTVAVLGEGGLAEELAQAGHRLAPLGERVEWVVAGMDREVTYARLAAASRSLRLGARLVATNADGTYPTPEGPVPGAGAIVGALAGVGYRPVMTLGKPNPAAFEAAIRRLGLPAEEIAAVGDRLETDIAGAHGAGLDSILVQTGIAREVPRDGLRPTWSARDIAAVAAGAIVAVEKGVQ